jgi:hypothetical protein
VSSPEAAASAAVDPSAAEGRILLWGFAAAVIVLAILGLVYSG